MVGPTSNESLAGRCAGQETVMINVLSQANIFSDNLDAGPISDHFHREKSWRGS